MGVASSFFGGGLFGIASSFPLKYTSAVMFGNGIAGLIMNASRALWLVIFPPDNNNKDDKNNFYGCMVYFSIACVILVCCIFSYFVMRKTEFAQFYLSHTVQTQPITDKEKESESLLKYKNGRSGPSEVVNDSLTQSTPSLGISSKKEEMLPFWQLYKQIFNMAFQVAFTFWITFVVFPGTCLDTKLDFLGDSKQVESWFVVIMITIFNIFDTLGRFLAGPCRI